MGKYCLPIDHCSSSCIPAGSSSIGTVTVTQDGAGTVKIVVDGDFQFVNTTSAPDAFLFDINGAPTITISKATPGWELVSGTAGSFGGGGWSFEYAMKCQFTPDGACPGKCVDLGEVHARCPIAKPEARAVQGNAAARIIVVSLRLRMVIAVDSDSLGTRLVGKLFARWSKHRDWVRADHGCLQAADGLTLIEDDSNGR